jgi:ABC-2 type transport system permease protein
VLVVPAVARLLFGITFAGGSTLLAAVALLYATLRMAVGFTFPFRGMPAWAQAMVEMRPVPHVPRIVRGLMLKASAAPQAAGEVAVLALMLAVVMAAADARCRVTLDRPGSQGFAIGVKHSLC